MRRQKIVPFKKLTEINEMLENGWNFEHTLVVGKTSYVVLSTYLQPELNTTGELRAIPVGRY